MSYELLDQEIAENTMRTLEEIRNLLERLVVAVEAIESGN